MKMIVLDIETANYEPTSICQLGIVVLEDFEIVDTKEYLIKPYPNYYIDSFTQLTGISSEDTDNAPTFDEVWEEIKYLFNKDTICVAHNAQFDISHIKAALIHYELQYDDFPVMCTLKLSRLMDLYVEDHKLETLCKYFNITNEHAHTALSDAYATAELLKALYMTGEYNIIEFLSYGYMQTISGITVPKKHQKSKSRKLFDSTQSKDVLVDECDIIKNPNMCGKYFVITGNLECWSRQDAYRHIKINGGFVEDNVTHKTNFLVTNSDKLTGKMKKAIEYIEQGQDIKIIDEDDLLGLLYDSFDLLEF